MDKLTLAVECCTSRSCEWEETCGKCPFNTKSEDQIGVDMANCIDELILSLFQKVKELEEKLEYKGKTNE